MTQSATTAPPNPSAPAKKNPPPRESGSVKETLESILVAFILAFIFRAFIVEAFVIPTGSMGPTLLGAHMRFRCNDCGYNFTSNYSAENRGDDMVIPASSAKDYYIYCPNCGYKFPFNEPADADNDASKPPVNYGDRILVLKYLYLFESPQRWDVVVFKSPALDPGVTEPTYRQNYIKRLIGRPGESIMVLDGDIYMSPTGDDLARYQIQAKPRYAQEALWRIIHDNDFYPVGRARDSRPKWEQPWRVREGSGWKLGEKPTDGRVFRFDNSAGESTIFFDREANPTHHAMTNWLTYNSSDRIDENLPRHVVHDLKVQFHYDRKSGDGPLRVLLSDGRDSFVAIISSGEAKLVKLDDSGNEEPIGAAKLPATDKPMRVELANADYQVTLRVNDSEIARTTPQQHHPNIPALLAAYDKGVRLEKQPWPSVEISAANQSSEVSHLSLWRDVYYTNDSGTEAFGIPRNPVHLGPDEYFVMGDNSAMSWDARFWNIPIDLPADNLRNIQGGRVPGRFMLGRAFFVYWPAGFRPGGNLWIPALAPDFGDMRFIR